MKNQSGIGANILAVCILLQLMFSLNVSANGLQQLTIKGIVTDENGVTLPGVNVVIAGTNTGTITDLDGAYKLDVPSSSSELVFTFIGYVEYRIVVGNTQEINVQMQVSAKSLNEVVVVGYGSQKKSDLTGSVASVSSESIQKLAVANAAEALKGKVSGVSISTVDAAPGGTTSIKIRGFNTISGNNDPLIVIDGYVNAGDLNTINPKDIKSIEVLKDASATAIYGARGANGVIIITTMSGTENKTKIELSASSTLKTIANKIEMMNAQQFLVMQNEATGGNDIPGLNDYETVDWQDEVYQQGIQQNYQLSVSGGNEKSTYMISGNYMSDKGIIQKSDFNRYSVRMKTDSKLLKWFSLSNSLYFMRSTSNGTPRNTMGYGMDPSISDAALTFYPHLPIKDNAGQYTNMSFKTNPLAIIDGRTDFTTRNYIYDYAEAEITPFKGLSLKTTLGGTYDVSNRNQYWSSTVKNVAGALGGITNRRNDANFAWSNENILTFQKSLAKHNITATGVFSQQYFRNDNYSVNGTGFLNDVLTFYNMRGANNITAGSGAYETTLKSGLGRVFYNYNSKYYLTLSGRWDGCSRFAENKKWGFFPAVALAWRLSEEQFVKNVPQINNLKLRLSYGQTGNYSALGPYQSLNSWNPTNVYAAIFNDKAQNVLTPSNLGNPDLGWETSTQFDIGIDFGLLDDRFTLVADYYHKVTSDLLLNVQLPSVSLLSNRFENVGEVENKGFELSLNSRNIAWANFSWTTTLNYSFYRNKVISLNGQQYILGGPYAGILQDQPTVVMVGKPLGTFWGYVNDGVFSDNAVYNNDKKNYTYLPDKAKPEGYIRLRDLNQDGLVDDKDRTVIGCAEPDFTFGFINNFTFKSFDLSVYIEGVIGGDVYNLQRYVIDNSNGETNVSTRLLNRWTAENRETDIVGAGKFVAKGNSQFVEDGTYIKFRDIQLGYNLPDKLVKAAHIKNLRFYFSLQNFIKFTNYTGFDPEVNMQGGSTSSQSLDLGAYPSAKSMTFGLNIGL